MLIEAVGFLVGLGFFPCILFGVIMFISFLTCDYIEKFVMKTFCSFKNRRRRFREKSGSDTKRKSFKSSRKSTSGNEDKSNGDQSKGKGKWLTDNGGAVPQAGTSRSSGSTTIDLTIVESELQPMYEDPPPAYNEALVAMIISLEKLSYYLGGVGVLLIICVVYYFIQGKKDVEEALRKQFEANEKARIAEGNGGLYTLCPTNPPGGTEGGTEGSGDNPPDILICDPSGMVGGKIDSVVPKVSYASYPKTEEERAWLRRDFVIQMIVADGGTAF